MSGGKETEGVERRRSEKNEGMDKGSIAQTSPGVVDDYMYLPKGSIAQTSPGVVDDYMYLPKGSIAGNLL